MHMTYSKSEPSEMESEGWGIFIFANLLALVAIALSIAWAKFVSKGKIHAKSPVTSAEPTDAPAVVHDAKKGKVCLNARETVFRRN